MKFTLNWLKEFVTIEAVPQKLAEMLTMAGLEVESVTALRALDSQAEDWLFEIGVTPNRGDCLGVMGLAREVAALTGTAVKTAAANLSGKDPNLAGRVSVNIENPSLCPRYSARIVDDVQVVPSPEWMRFRLEACGIRAINNVVDITNYVMLETGQPLHAFDLDRLPAAKIVVRSANGLDKFTTLDGVERVLVKDDLLICDGDLPIALAGVMGGRETEVRQETRALLLESANFDPTSIRRTAKRLALHSDASHRFERGVDPEGTVAAVDRAVALLAEFASASPASGVVDRYPQPAKPKTITLQEQRVEKLLGVKIAGEVAEGLLRSLGVKTQRQSKSKEIKAIPPTSRPDLTREVDLIEELARLYGYQNIPSTMPLLRSSGGKIDLELASERRVRSFLAGEGLVEVMNLPFTTDKFNRSFRGLWDGVPAPVTVLNPLTKESGEMRLSLIPGLIENLRRNLAQKAESVFAYHLGKVFRLAANGESEERQCLGGILYGSRARRGLRQADESPIGFLDCKGLLEGALDLFRIDSEGAWKAAALSILHPGRAAAIVRDGTNLGYVGQIHPDVGDQLDLPPFWIFELDFRHLLEYAPRRITARFLPRFPSVERDFAIVVDGEFASQRIISWIKNLSQPLIENVQVFDQYHGAPVPEGKKSLAYQISYRAEDRTLTDTEVQTLHQGLVDQIGKLFGAQLRS